jgi:hypothetical protein
MVIDFIFSVPLCKNLVVPPYYMYMKKAVLLQEAHILDALIVWNWKLYRGYVAVCVFKVLVTLSFCFYKFYASTCLNKYQVTGNIRIKRCY